MRNVLLSVVVAVATAFVVAFWPAPERVPAVLPSSPLRAETSAPAVPPQQASTEAREPAAVVKVPGEHGLVPMTARLVGWPDVSIDPLSEPIAADDGMDWDTVAWNGEVDGEIVDPVWFGD